MASQRICALVVLALCALAANSVLADSTAKAVATIGEAAPVHSEGEHEPKHLIRIRGGLLITRSSALGADVLIVKSFVTDIVLGLASDADDGSMPQRGLIDTSHSSKDEKSAEEIVGGVVPLVAMVDDLPMFMAARMRRCRRFRIAAAIAAAQLATAQARRSQGDFAPDTTALAAVDVQRSGEAENEAIVTVDFLPENFTMEGVAASVKNLLMYADTIFILEIAMAVSCFVVAAVILLYNGHEEEEQQTITYSIMAQPTISAPLLIPNGPDGKASLPPPRREGTAAPVASYHPPELPHVLVYTPVQSTASA